MKIAWFCFRYSDPRQTGDGPALLLTCFLNICLNFSIGSGVLGCFLGSFQLWKDLLQKRSCSLSLSASPAGQRVSPAFDESFGFDSAGFQPLCATPGDDFGFSLGPEFFVLKSTSHPASHHPGWDRGQCLILQSFPMIAQRDDWCSSGNTTRVASASNICEKKIFNPVLRN